MSEPNAPNVTTKEDLIRGIDVMIGFVEYNGDTRAILDEIYSLRLRLPKSQDIEKVIREKKKPKSAAANQSPNSGPGKFYGPEDFLKKRESSETTEPQSVKPAEHNPQAKAPAPVEPTTESNDQKIIDLFADGLPYAKTKYKKVEKFVKAVNDLGLPIAGTDWETAWGTFEQAINEIK